MHIRSDTVQYVTLPAFPRQKYFHEIASMLHYTYIDSFVKIEKNGVYYAVRSGYLNLILVKFDPQKYEAVVTCS